MGHQGRLEQKGKKNGRKWTWALGTRNMGFGFCHPYTLNELFTLFMPQFL